MDIVFEAIINETKQNNDFAIATVVKTKGSTPQKTGSKLLIKNDGSSVGTLGGGCVEGDIWFAATEILKSKAKSEYKEYFLNEDIAARDGLVCGGTMYFLIEPFYQDNLFNSFANNVVEAYSGKKPVGLATLINKQNSSTGQKIYFDSTGNPSGSFNDKQIDAEVYNSILDLLPYGKSKMIDIDKDHAVFIETYASHPTLILIGGGHISKSLAPLAQSVGFKMIVIDDREDFANPERFPEAECTIVSDYKNAFSSNQFEVNKNSMIVIATRGHNFDDIALESAINTNAGYIGLVGSERKAIMIFEQLLSRGIDIAKLKTINTPIGLDIKAATPEEIAVSIIAELIQYRLGGKGGSLKIKDQKIDSIYNKLQKKAKIPKNIDGDQSVLHPIRGSSR